MPKESTETQDGFPSWLNGEFLEKALNYEHSDGYLKVTSYDIKRATAPGDNYMSLIHRATVEVTRGGHSEKRSLIIKSQPAGERLQEISKKYRLFELETKMLKEVLPAMHDLLREADVDNFTPFSAKFLYSNFGAPAHVIVVEDLKESDFRMVERRGTTGLDETHCLLAMRKIAQFHAASIVLKQKNPQLLENFLHSTLNDMLLEEFSDYLKNYITALCDEIDKKHEELKTFAGRLRKIAENSIARWIEGRERNDKEFNVLAHGDFWVNNMMFRYSNESHQVTDMRFVDYQNSVWTSPAVDLLYFLSSSPSNGLLKNETVFMKEYHRVLGETLSALGYQHMHITLEQLNELLENRGFYGMLSIFCIRHAVLVDDDAIIDLDQLVKKEDMSFKFSKNFIESLKIQMPLMDERGWLI